MATANIAVKRGRTILDRDLLDSSAAPAPAAPPLAVTRPPAVRTGDPAAPINTPGPVASQPHQLNAAGRGVTPEQYYRDYLQNFGVTLRQSVPTGWDDLVKAMQTEGYNATLDSRTDGLHKGVMLNGQFVKLLNGLDQPIWEQGGGATGGSEASGGNVFSDPATAGWETLLRQVAGQLSTPQTTADYGGLQDYLRSYMTQLQGPGYSAPQQELIQNQVLDPMTQERDAQKQRVIEQAAARGLTPTSGPVLEQLAMIDRGYSGARTKAQGGFATQQIGLEKQQAAQAAQVGQMLQALQLGQQTGNEGRALQAVGLMGQLPALADSRLGAANQTLSATNAPLATILSYLLGQQGRQQQQQQFDAVQNQAYWDSIGRLVGGIFT